MRLLDGQGGNGTQTVWVEIKLDGQTRESLTVFLIWDYAFLRPNASSSLAVNAFLASPCARCRLASWFGTVTKLQTEQGLFGSTAPAPALVPRFFGPAPSPSTSR